MEQKTLTTTLRYLHITPRKTRRLVDVIRGCAVHEAQARLMVSSQRAREALLKLLHSAFVSAEQVLKVAPSQLYIKEIYVDQGPKTGRWTPRARGSASKIERKTSHVTLTLGILSDAPSSRFTFIEKQKRKKKEEVQKKNAEKSLHAHEGAHDEKKKTEEGKHDVVRKEKASKKGFLREAFRRKSI